MPPFYHDEYSNSNGLLECLLSHLSFNPNSIELLKINYHQFRHNLVGLYDGCDWIVKK